MEHQLFTITQSAVIKNATGEILILRHTAGKWLLPGGKINTGENLFNGLQRELSEETSIAEFTIVKILDADSWIEGGNGFCVITYLVAIKNDATIKLSDEHKEYAWVGLKNLDNYDFWNPKIKERIRKALS